MIVVDERSGRTVAGDENKGEADDEIHVILWQ